MSLFDRLLLGLGTTLVLGGVAWGALRAADHAADHPAGGPAIVAGTPTGAPPPAQTGEGLDVATGNPLPPDDAAVGAGRNPWGDASLPEGVRIDPTTLQLVGLKLDPEPGSVVLDWDLLTTYTYQQDLAGLPEAIASLDGRRIVVAGFLLPLYEFADIKEFNLVASHWSCCFGRAPGINGWIHVNLADDAPGLGLTNEPLRVSGTLRLKEHKEAGVVISIYRLDDARARSLTD